MQTGAATPGLLDKWRRLFKQAEPLSLTTKVCVGRRAGLPLWPIESFYGFAPAVFWQALAGDFCHPAVEFFLNRPIIAA